MACERILIVDDDPDIRDVLTLILEAQGFQVTIARDGVECLEKLSKEKPDLMILDLLMPRMDGFAVYKALQDSSKWTEYKNMAILILTSVREEASRRRYELETGQTLKTDHYVEKPISPEILIDTVKKLINRRE